MLTESHSPHFRAFLASAEVVRRFGISMSPVIGRTGSVKGSTTFLNPNTAWKVPSNLPLPRMTLKLADLSPSMRSWLHNYRAPKSPA